MRYLPILPLFLMFAGCGGGAVEDSGATNDTLVTAPASMVERIRAQEDSLFAKSVFDRRGAIALQDVYLAFAKNNPSDTMAPEYLFRAAGLASTLKEPQKSLDLYGRIIMDYPRWRRLPDTYYLRAFTIENELNDKAEAQKAYQEVIDRFPQHAFAAQAEQAIKNLPYTDEELIDRFKKMNPEVPKDAASSAK